MKRIEAVLLAAGYSSRMGKMKALLPIGTTTVIRKQVEELRRCVDRIIVVTGYRGEEVADHIRDYPADVVWNPCFADGMFTSVKAGLLSLSADVEACLILPVDYPLVTSDMIQKLIREYERGEFPVVYPSFAMRKGHPPVIAAGCISQILQYQGDRGLKGALKPFDGAAGYVLMDDAGCVMDMDTPGDYQNILAVAGQQAWLSGNR